MKNIMIARVIQVLKHFNPSWQLQSVQLNYPLAEHISIFYTDAEGRFIQRIIQLPGGETVDRTLLQEKESRKDN